MSDYESSLLKNNSRTFLKKNFKNENSVFLNYLETCQLILTLILTFICGNYNAWGTRISWQIKQ